MNYPPEHHPVFMLRDALTALGATAEFNGRDARTLGCWGLIVNGKPMAWLIDNRLPHEAVNEDPAARELLARGVLVCHAQHDDCERVGGRWLPLACSPSYLTPLPKHDEMRIRENTHDAGFCGFIHDMGRATLLTHLGAFCKLNAQSGVFGADAVTVYTSATCGVNIPSHYGQPYCTDLNMRVYEIMGCGVPLVTNALPALAAIGFVDGVHGMAYKDPDHLCQIVHYLSKRPLEAMRMGQAARLMVESTHTYAQRAALVLEWLN